MALYDTTNFPMGKGSRSEVLWRQLFSSRDLDARGGKEITSLLRSNLAGCRQVPSCLRLCLCRCLCKAPAWVFVCAIPRIYNCWKRQHLWNPLNFRFRTLEPGSMWQTLRRCCSWLVTKRKSLSRSVQEVTCAHFVYIINCRGLLFCRLQSKRRFRWEGNPDTEGRLSALEIQGKKKYYNSSSVKAAKLEIPLLKLTPSRTF